MPRLTINEPPPVTLPPTTYDLTGLTRTEVEVILAAVGAVNIASGRAIENRVGDAIVSVYDSLRGVIPIGERRFFVGHDNKVVAFE